MLFSIPEGPKITSLTPWGILKAMIYSVSGKVVSRGDNFLIMEAAGVGFKIFTNQRTLAALPLEGNAAKLFCHLRVKEDGLDLYGFYDEHELHFFELLISVSGVGPRSGLAVLQVAELKHLAAAIKEGRPDVLTRASGIGRKTAERIIIELRGKVEAEKSESVVKKMEADSDLVETLVGLGYGRDQARSALSKVDEKVLDLETRLKAALKILSR